MMNKLMREYTQKAEREFEELKAQLVGLKLKFQLAVLGDSEEAMIEAANEIWRLEGRMNNYYEIHKIILENYEEG